MHALHFQELHKSRPDLVKDGKLTQDGIREWFKMQSEIMEDAMMKDTARAKRQLKPVTKQTVIRRNTET